MKYWLFSLIMLIPVLGFAGEKVISGVVLDQEDDLPIIGAHVIVKDSDPVIGAITDFDGNYSLNLRGLENPTLIISFVGYKSQIIEVNSSDLPQDLTISLVSEMLQTVVVTASKGTEPVNEFATISARRITIDETEKLPGGFNDIGRMAQNFAGVQKADDTTNEIVVRGNNPGSVLWRIDGIDVPNPNHFSELGTSGGPLSLLNTNTIRDSDFYTGAFPAEYGNATGAAFDIRLKNGRKDRVHFLGQVGFNGFEAMIDGPFAKNSDATFMINYRNSNLTLIEKMNLIDFDIHLGVPTFNDLAFKVNLPTSKHGTFSAFGITGKSDVSTEASRIISNGDSREDAVQKAKDEARDEHFGSLTGIYGINHHYRLGDNTLIQSNLSYTLSNSYFNLDTLDLHFKPHQNYEQNFLENRIAGSVKADHYFNNQHQIKAGFTFTRLNYHINQSIFNPLLNDMIGFRDERHNTSLINSFLQYKFQNESGRLSVSPGLHYQHFLLNNTYSVEPRLSASYTISDAHKLNIGIGQHSQTLPLNVFFQLGNQDSSTPENLNRNLGFQKSIHYVVGHNWQLKDNLKLNSELYYQKLYDVPVSGNALNSWSLINSGGFDYGNEMPTVLMNSGEGQNYGVDFTLEQSLNRGWNGMVTTSLYKSQYAGSDGIWRNTTWDGNYIVNAIVGKEISLASNKLNFNLKTNWAGGKRYTPIDLDASREAGRTIRNHDMDFTEKYPDYFKMDFRIGFEMPINRFTHEFVLDFQNITNRRNVLFDSYSPTTRNIKTTYQLEFFPVFQYRFLF